MLKSSHQKLSKITNTLKLKTKLEKKTSLLSVLGIHKSELCSENE